MVYIVMALSMQIILPLNASASWALEHGVGQVNMPVTTANKLANKYFQTGLALMESFEFDDAKLYFLKAQKQDPKFAMAYWGEAMTSVIFLWFLVDYPTIEKVYQRMEQQADLRNLSPLEKALINSTKVLFTASGRNLEAASKQSAIFKYRLAMAKVYQSFKFNPDVIYLYVHSILATRHGINDYPTNFKAGTLLKSVYENNSSHPGVNHLLLHSFENVAQSYMAKDAAEHYPKIAPGAIHGLHMPSHYYFYQGNWQRLVELNQIAWDESLKRQKAMKLDDDSLEYHGYSWLIYSYLQLNDAPKALAAINDISHKQVSVKRDKYLGYVIGQFLLHTQQDPKLSKSVEAIPINTKHFNAETKAGYLFSMAVRNGYTNIIEIDKAIDHIQKTILPQIKNQAPTVRDEVAIIFKQLNALKIYATGKPNEAIELLGKVAKEEDNSYREHGVPMVVKPTHELLGDLLMAENRYGEALLEYKKELLHNSLRRLSVEGLMLAATKTGNDIERQYAALMLQKL